MCWLEMPPKDESHAERGAKIQKKRKKSLRFDSRPGLKNAHCVSGVPNQRAGFVLSPLSCLLILVGGWSRIFHLDPIVMCWAVRA